MFGCMYVIVVCVIVYMCGCLCVWMCVCGCMVECVCMIYM